MLEVITESRGLEAYCRGLEGERYVALDTEFLRDSTYWPRLCLVQACAGGRGVIIDPLAEGMDLSPLYEVFDNPKIVKVFHAARQDLEIFYHERQRFPLPLFDTQVAAMACGYGDSASYESLAQQILKVEIDKGSRYTDWARRPLSESQLRYALGDVIHLCGIYEHLSESLESANRHSWIEEKMLSLTDSDLYDMTPEKAGHKIRLRVSGKRRQGFLFALAAWREEEAQRRDVPRGRVMRDDLLREVALRAPCDERALEEMRGVPRGFAQSSAGRRLLGALKRAAENPEAMEKHITKSASPKRGNSGRVDMLRLLLKHACEAHGIAPNLLVSNGDLEKIASGDTEMDVFSGWKREVFGESAMQLLRGEICLSLENGKIQPIRCTDC